MEAFDYMVLALDFMDFVDFHF